MAAIARGGLRTLYALQQEAGRQPGSVKGVLGHLEAQGLLSRSVGTKRGRRDMTVTEAGEECLRNEWHQCLDPTREIESVLRSATSVDGHATPAHADRDPRPTAREVRKPPPGIRRTATRRLRRLSAGGLRPMT